MVPLKNAGIVLGLLIAVTGAAQMLPSAAKFMQVMDAGMKHMDREMANAPMKGDSSLTLGQTSRHAPQVMQVDST